MHNHWPWRRAALVALLAGYITLVAGMVRAESQPGKGPSATNSESRIEPSAAASSTQVASSQPEGMRSWPWWLWVLIGFGGLFVLLLLCVVVGMILAACGAEEAAEAAFTIPTAVVSGIAEAVRSSTSGR